MILDFLDPIKRNLKRYGSVVNDINSLEPEISKLSNEELASKTEEFKARLNNGI